MRYRMPVVLMILLPALAGWCSAASDSDADISSVKAFNQAYAAAVQKADVSTMVNLWAPDGVMLPAGEPAVVGSKQIHAWLTRNEPDTNVVKISNDVSNWKDITVAGDYAFEWANTFIDIRSKDDQAGAHMTGTVLQVLKKEPDGSWKLYRSSWSHEGRQKDK